MTSRAFLDGLQDRANRLRIHSIRATTAAGSGHPTSCCSAADLVAALFFDVMRFRPAEPRADESDRTVFVLLGDGECAEGSVWEAAAIAGYYRLDTLVAIVDVNRLGQSQATMLEHDVQAYRKRFEAFGWRAVAVDGHDMSEVVRALRRARRRSGRPVAVVARTIK